MGGITMAMATVKQPQEPKTIQATQPDQATEFDETHDRYQLVSMGWEKANLWLRYAH